MCKARGTGSIPGLAAEELCYVMLLFLILTIPLISLSPVLPAALKCKKNINEGSSSSLEERQPKPIFLKVIFLLLKTGLLLWWRSEMLSEV